MGCRKFSGFENALYQEPLNGFYICHYISFTLCLVRGESKG